MKITGIKKQYLAALVFLFLSSLALNAQNLPTRIRPFTFPCARDKGIGGVHVGLTDDFSTLWNNPAGLASVKEQKFIAALSFDVIDVDVAYNVLVNENRAAELLKLIQNNFEANIDMGGPIAFGRVGNNWGISFYNVSRVNFAWDPQDAFAIQTTVSEEFVLTTGFGINVLDAGIHKIEIGTSGKLFFRGGYNGPPLYINQVKHFLEMVADWPFEAQLGFGLDTGIRWNIADCVSFALVGYDVFTPVFVTEYSTIKQFWIGEKTTDGWVPVIPRLSGGITWTWNYEPIHRYFSDIILSVDYKGFLTTLTTPIRSPLLDISAGLEIRFHEVFSLRAGFADMLPGGGVGFDWTFMQLDFAIFGKEMGSQPGDNVTWCIALDFTFKY
ncbi:hypothetical protein AGMMS50212_15360 [Spirochaetia bacterium]|nr:hypothetical protein AGMMS50212_15360 [Spirochaetia bacterium]